MSLAWRRLSDTRMASECNRYVVDREPTYCERDLQRQSTVVSAS